MITDEWIYQIEQQLPFRPTEGQHEAVVRVSSFLADRRRDCAFILRGSAGTGKTSVARAIVLALTVMRQKVVLMAPTGRAAKVFSMGTGHGAFTIHRKIYRQQSYLSGQFSLNDNLHTDTVFMVDEASMMAAGLLDDVVKYVYQARNCRMILIGDTAQLPPVESDEALALVGDYVAGYGLHVSECDLVEVLRQSEESGVLWNATMVRHMITYDEMTQLPKIRFDGFADISICHGTDLVEQLASSYSKVGLDETIVITRSNKRANAYNQGIRARIFDYEDELTSGDQLMIVKNNYNIMSPIEEGKAFTLFNGDHGVVRRVRNTRSLYGFRFADVYLQLPDYDDMELMTTVIIDTLSSEAPALTTGQQEELYNKVMEDYADIPLKHDRLQALRKDTYFNALQVKYAYAVTCHKAQGGQWEHVYLDQGYMTDDMLTPSYIHWLYTAFTRATSHLYLVNWPKEQIELA